MSFSERKYLFSSFFFMSLFVSTIIHWPNVINAVETDLNQGQEADAEEKISQMSYQTSFGHCPNKTAGEFTLLVTKFFDEKKSLYSVKKKILKEKWKEKFFLSEYQIQYDPLKALLKVSLNCPTPLMKVSVYKKQSGESYEALLVDSGELYDPTYEQLLRLEHRLGHDLPLLALPVKEMEKDVQKEITSLIKNVSEQFRRKISEMIVDDEKKLIVILSVKNQPSSAFLGEESWDEKFKSLERIIKHLEGESKIPATIDLTNAKKVVVKFKDNS